MSASPPRDALGRWLIIAGVGIAAVAVAASFLMAGTPAERRAVRLDERRVSDLQHVSLAVETYWKREGRLPESMQEIARERRLDTSDPVTGKAYTYEATGKTRYRLCAVFATDDSVRPSRPIAEWGHGIGRECFDKRVDRD